MSYRIRGSLARMVYNRMLEDQNEQSFDRNEWYQLNRAGLSSALCEKYLELHEDGETHDFLTTSAAKSDQIFVQIFHSLVKSLLYWAISSTSINGLLGRGSMFVFSQAQFMALLNVSETWKSSRLLDIGAGDGMVTSKMSPFFDEVYVTEVSMPMIWRLDSLGFRIADAYRWHETDIQYDVISLLNVLDRCSHPIDLLMSIKRRLVPGTGRLILAVVFPFRPYVESTSDHKAAQTLVVTGNTVEEQIGSFVTNVLEPGGFRVERFSRLPYLCEGDMEHSYYVLDDIVFVLSLSP